MISPLLNLAILEMLMKLDITWMVVTLKEVVLLWSLPRGVLVVPGNTWVGVHRLDLDDALTVALMVIGLVIAKLGIGRISVTAVGKEVI